MNWNFTKFENKLSGINLELVEYIQHNGDENTLTLVFTSGNNLIVSGNDMIDEFLSDLMSQLGWKRGDKKPELKLVPPSPPEESE